MYYSNISNEELQYFSKQTVPNFTIKLTDALTSGLFHVETIKPNVLFKLYPLFYTGTIYTNSDMDIVLDDLTILCTKQDKETYITCISNPDEDIQDYQNYTTFKALNSNLNTNEFNGLVSLYRANIIHEDNITIGETVTGEYGNYDFDVEGCTVIDTGIVIDEDTITAEPRVQLTDNVFHFSTYTLNLEIIHYTDTKIIDDDTDFKVVETLRLELPPEEWVTIPLANLSDGYIISLEANVEIVHDKPVIPDIVKSINVNSVPDIIQSGENAEIYATGLNNGGLAVEDGHIIHFFEKISPVIDVSASAPIIQTNEDTELYAKVKDDDGSLATGVKVYFYERED